MVKFPGRNKLTLADTLLNGDIHQYNADILTAIVTDMRWAHIKKSKTSVIPEGFVVKRSQAKRILYAFLSGASGAKLWSYIFGILDEVNGPILKKAFIKAVEVDIGKVSECYRESPNAK